MPTYEYACPSCGTFEQVQRIVDLALKVCPKCGAEVKRLISGSSFALKGSGWYADGYAAPGSNSRPATSAVPGKPVGKVPSKPST